MAELESASAYWTFSTAASTGAVGLKAFNGKGKSAQYTAYIEAAAGSSATVEIQTRNGSSSGAWASLASTTVSTSIRVMQFNGPLEWIRPYATVKSTGGLTVQLFGN